MTFATGSDKFKMFNIVLANPQIPQNTGNIGRLCVNTGSRLHLIFPLGFSLEDKYLRRAGLDYWDELDLKLYPEIDSFFSENEKKPMCFFSTKAKKVFWECPYEKGSYLVFGNETGGLPPEIHAKFADSFYKIPMGGEAARSLNLSNSVAVALYEGIRRYCHQIKDLNIRANNEHEISNGEVRKEKF